MATGRTERGKSMVRNRDTCLGPIETSEDIYILYNTAATTDENYRKLKIKAKVQVVRGTSPRGRRVTVRTTSRMEQTNEK